VSDAASRHERVSDVLAQARRLEGAARDAFLRDACGEDADLRSEVDSLLRHGAAGAALLDSDHLATRIRDRATRILAAEQSHLPSSVGGHRVVRLIGEGGMGVVYEAEQERPRRRVALKVLRRGIASPEHLRRFEREIALLARLGHPGIARVHAAGIDESDALAGPRPWFTMELIDGVPLTTAARREGMTLTKRLELLARTCEAVAHAHARGIVHRDLKPANILVDAAGDPHVLDFGIAVATGADELTRATRTGDVIGTLAYMSPEQATGRAAAADARTDVHALGVIGFEMLTGRLPFDVDDLPLPEVARHVAEDEPPSLGAIDPSLRGGPSTIIAMALEKDPARRYADAGEMAADLRRLLADEPLVAQPASVTENLRRAARRHRALLAGAIVAVLALSIGLAFAVRFAIVADRARESASLAEGEATRQRDLARDPLYESLMREARAIRVARQPGYQRELFDRLRQAASLAATGWDAEAIRTEASLSLGDPLGQVPVKLVIPDAGVMIDGREKSESNVIDGTGSVVAHGTSLGLLAIYDASTGVEVATLEDQGAIADLAFASPTRLFGAIAPQDAEGDAPAAPPRIAEWQRDAAGAWTLHATRDAARVAKLLATRAAAIAVSEGSRGRFELVDLASDARLGTTPLLPLALAADGRRVALQSADGESIVLWDLASGAALRTLRPGLARVDEAAFNDDGSAVACLTTSGVAVFDTASGEELCTFRGYYQSAAFVDHATLALTQAQARDLRLVNIAANNDVARLGLTAWRYAFGGDAVLAVGTGEGRVIKLGDTPERRRFLGHAGGVPAIEFAGEGKQLITTGKDETIRVWDVASGRESGRWDSPDGPGQALAVSPDGRFAATAEWSATVVRAWSVATGRPILALDRPDGAHPLVTNVGFSPDGRYLVALGSVLQIWELEPSSDAPDAGLAAREIRAANGLSWSQAFDPTGHWLASTSPPDRGMGIDLLRVGGGTDPAHVIATTGGIQAIGWSPRNGDFVIVAVGSILELIDPERALIVRRVPTLLPSEASGPTIGNLRISPDGSLAAVRNASSRGVNILDLASGRRLFALPDLTSSVWWLAWNPAGTKLAVSTSEGEVSTWDLAAARARLEEAGLWDMADPRMASGASAGS